MKLCCAVAVAVLLLALCSLGESQSSAPPDECCFKFYTKPIPAGRIKAYQETHASCPKKGVIFTTVADKKLCANPEDKQVQDIMEKNLFGTPAPSR